MSWYAQAPSNIALIKYMGKKSEGINIPTNPSLSYTLNQLISSVELASYDGKDDRWEPLIIPGAAEFKLSTPSQERFLRHLTNIKSKFNYTGSFIVRSNNNFPHSTGLASSASSFAALTKCAALALSDLTQTPMPSVDIQSAWSRAGSGSSCRSFYSPWAMWDEEDVTLIELPYPELRHEVIVISSDEKKISSSEAHRRVSTSPLYPRRHIRASENLAELLYAFHARNWQEAYQICWREFQDMHELFETCATPFSYMTDKTHQVLRSLQAEWKKLGDGPLVTMDAGPNIHLLYRPDQKEMANKFKENYLDCTYDA